MATIVPRMHLWFDSFFLRDDFHHFFIYNQDIIESTHNCDRDNDFFKKERITKDKWNKIFIIAW